MSNCVWPTTAAPLYAQDPEENAKILSSWTGGIQAVAQLFSYLNQLHIIGAGLVDATECCPVVGHIVGELTLATKLQTTSVVRCCLAFSDPV